MPTTRLISTDLPALLPQTDRAPGLHVSTIINSICVGLGHYAPSENRPTRKMELGCVWEHAWAHRLMLDDPGRYYREWDDAHGYWKCGMAVERDNIHGNLDLLDLHDWAVEDCKATWMSTKHGPDSTKVWKWWVQVMAYCWMLGAVTGTPARVGRLRVAFVMGDWKSEDVYTPTWEREWSDEELEANWVMLREHGRRMEMEGIGYE